MLRVSLALGTLTFFGSVLIYYIKLHDVLARVVRPIPVATRDVQEADVERARRMAELTSELKRLEGRISRPRCGAGQYYSGGVCKDADTLSEKLELLRQIERSEASRQQIEDALKALEAVIAAERHKGGFGGSSTLARFVNLDAPDTGYAERTLPVAVSLKQLRSAAERAAQKSVNVETGIDARAGPDGKVEIAVPAEKDFYLVDVDISAPGFRTADGEWTRQIRVPKVGDSELARFQLVPLAGEPDAGERWITARLFLEGRHLANLSRPIRIEALPQRTVELPPAARATRLSAQPVQRRSSNFVVDLEMSGADLDIVLDYDDPIALGPGRIIVRSPHMAAPIIERFVTRPELRDWMEDEYRRVVAMARAHNRGALAIGVTDASSAREQMIATLRGIGRTLYREHVPEAFKRALAVVEAKTATVAIQITSNSPLIPWEIVVPDQTAMPGAAKPEFLGIAHRIARLTPKRSIEQADNPVRRLRLVELHAVAPRYDGADFLPFQSRELDSLKHFVGFRQSDGTFATLRNLLKSQITGIVHFVGHGEVNAHGSGKPVFGIRLADAVLDPGSWRDLTNAGTRGAPFYFFNACDSGRTAYTGGFVQGCGAELLAAGAGGFIGGQWPLSDSAAAVFAAEFYQAVEAPIYESVAVSDILRAVRRRFYDTGDPTFLAYAFFGHVNLHFELPGRAPVTLPARDGR